jgi:hypothetical protein
MSDDQVLEAMAERLNKMSPDERSLELIKLAQRTPILRIQA